MAGFNVIMINKRNILPGVVGTVELADGSIAGADLVDGAITAQKLANASVTNEKMDNTDQFGIDVTRGLYQNPLTVTATGASETKVLSEEEITEYNNIIANADGNNGYIISFENCAAERSIYIYNNSATKSVRFGATTNYVEIPADFWCAAYVQTDGDVFAISPIMDSANDGLIKPDGIDRSQNFAMDITRALVQTELAITPTSDDETIVLTEAQCEDYNNFSVQSTAFDGAIVSFANNAKSRVSYIYNADADADVQFGATTKNVVLPPGYWCGVYVQDDGDVFAITPLIGSEDAGLISENSIADDAVTSAKVKAGEVLDVSVQRPAVIQELEVDLTDSVQLTEEQVTQYNNIVITTAGTNKVLSLPASMTNQIKDLTFINETAEDITVGAETSTYTVRAGNILVANIATDGNVYQTGGTPPSVAGSAPYVVVAAANAPTEVKEHAAYICDGASDDVQIQAALNSGRAEVVLSTGTFNLAAAVSIPAGITLRGANTQTILNRPAAAAISLVTMAGAGSRLDNVKLDSDEDDAAAAVPVIAVTGNDCEIRDVYVTATNQPISIVADDTKVYDSYLATLDTSTPVIGIEGYDNIVDSCEVRYTYRGFEIAVGSDGSIIENCVIQGLDGTVANGRVINNASNTISVKNCRINGTGGDYGIVSSGDTLKVNNCNITMVNGDCVSSTGDELIVTGCTLESVYAGVYVKPNSSIYDINISSNTINVGAAGIELNKCIRGTIDGNVVKNTAADIAPVAVVDSSNSITMSNNAITPTNVANTGVYISDSSSINITGNEIGNNSTGCYYGINLANTTSFINISSNIIDYARKTGIYANNATSTVITGNTIVYFDNSMQAYGTDGNYVNKVATGNSLRIKTYGNTYTASGITTISGSTYIVVVGNMIEYRGGNAVNNYTVETGNTSRNRTS